MNVQVRMTTVFHHRSTHTFKDMIPLILSHGRYHVCVGSLMLASKQTQLIHCGCNYLTRTCSSGTFLTYGCSAWDIASEMPPNISKSAFIFMHPDRYQTNAHSPTQPAGFHDAPTAPGSAYQCLIANTYLKSCVSRKLTHYRDQKDSHHLTHFSNLCGTPSYTLTKLV